MRATTAALARLDHERGGVDGQHRRVVDLRLAAPAAAAWVVLALAIGAPDSLVLFASIAWAVTALCLIGISRAKSGRTSRSWVSIIALACCASAVLLTVAAARAPDRAPGAMLEAAAASRFVIVSATTTQTIFADTTSFTVTITEVDIGGRRLDVSVPARAFGNAVGSELGIGSVVELRGTLAATEPGDDIGFLLFTDEPPEALQHPPPLIDWANALRGGLRMAAADLPGDGGELLPGLAIGDTSAVEPDLDHAMKASSLSHLTAVSGANCAIVIALVMVLTAALRMPRGWRIGVALATLGGFVVLVTPEPSVLRAALMALLVLVTSAMGRGAQGLPLLALAVLILLVGDPWLARDYGFTLSVLATGGLLLLSGPLTRVLSKALPTPIAAALAIPLAAQLACQPVLILLAPSIPVFGVVANVLAGPAAPAATIIGLIACLTLAFVPPLGVAIAHIAWVPAAWIAATARFFADLPGSRLGVVEGWLGVAGVAALTVVGLIALMTRQPRWRAVATSVLAIVSVAAIGSGLGTAVRVGLTRPANWQIAMCDIGQGDAALIRDGPDIAVIDTGPDPALMTECLDKLGIDQVDLLVLTHFDLDHVGGAAALIGRVDRVLIGPEDRPQALRLIEKLRSGGASVDQVRQGDTGALGDTGWEVLWPPARMTGIEPGNDASLIFLFGDDDRCDGCLTSLFLGDLGQESQSRLMGAVRIPQVDVVKVAHHGSKDQSARLYQQAHATIGLIGVGAENEYGHPTPELLDILTSTGTTAVRTDLDGIALLAAGADGTVTVWTERGE